MYTIVNLLLDGFWSKNIIYLEENYENYVKMTGNIYLYILEGEILDLPEYDNDNKCFKKK